MSQVEDLLTPVTLGFGDIVEFPIRPFADSVLFKWGERSVVTEVLDGGRAFSASPIYYEDNGDEVLALWGGTIWPPFRKTGEKWSLRRVAEAIQRGIGQVSVEEIMEEGRAESEQEPVEYSMGSITSGGIGEID